jgi:predicted nicotinamide N-methyase
LVLVNAILYCWYLGLRLKHRVGKKILWCMLALPWRKHDTLVVNGKSVDLEEGDSVPGLDTTGSLFWDASQVLIDWLIAHKEELDLSYVVELGSGTGALAIGMVWIGASAVVATDLRHALPLIVKNAQRNNVNLETRVLEFGQPALVEASLVIASDVVYSSALVQPLCDTLHSFGKAKIVLCNKIRSDSLIKELEAALPRPFERHELLGEFVLHVLQ